MIKTAEFVTPGHPDKRCDFIADSILDAYLAGDRNSRVAVEVMGGHNLITINGEVTSKTRPDIVALVKGIIAAKEYLINPAGEWTQGGFDADTGVSGRKLIVDNYGPEVRIGGGSFSGKDYTKVDRSAAYMARKVAVELLKARGAKIVETKIAYAIGKAEPVMAAAAVDGVEEAIVGYDLTPRGIRAALSLDTVRYADTCTWGHFGRGFNWDK